MSKLKLCLKNVLYILYGGLSAFYTPTFLLISFNLMHGIANNPDGEVLVPFGVIALLTILIIDIGIIVKTVISKSMTKLEKVLTISLFVMAKIGGSLMLEKNDWGFFLECFQWKLTH